MKNKKLLYNNPLYFSFISGILISLSISIFYGVFSQANLSSNWYCLIIISGLEFFSAFLFINITVLLEKRIENCKREKIISNSNDSLMLIYERLYPKTYWKLQVKFYIAICLAILGLVLLVIPHV